MDETQTSTTPGYRIKLFLKKAGVFLIVKALYSFPGTLSGFIKYHFYKKKQFILILSTMRSGSTLLKALLSNAPDIEQIPEAFFQIDNNKYFTYNKFYKLSSSDVIVLKEPSHYPSFRNYPQFPNVEFKTITLVRNPLDTIISLRKMNKELNTFLSDEELLNYWLITTENLINKKNRVNNITVIYENLIERPVEITKELFKFIGSVKKEGVDTYSRPEKYKWEWKKDDGGDVIKSLRVQKVEKDYSNEKSLINLICQNQRVLNVMKEFGIPQVWNKSKNK